MDRRKLNTRGGAGGRQAWQGFAWLNLARTLGQPCRCPDKLCKGVDTNRPFSEVSCGCGKYALDQIRLD